MSIRAITVERGIVTLAHESQLPTLNGRGRRNPNNVGTRRTGTDSVDTISSPTGNLDRQEEEELEGGFNDYENNDIWSEDDEDSEEEEIQ